MIRLWWKRLTTRVDFALVAFAEAVERNTREMKVRYEARKLIRRADRMAKERKRQRRYYDPGSEAKPRNLEKDASGSKRKFSTRKGLAPGANLERLQQARSEQEAKKARRAARARGE